MRVGSSQLPPDCSDDIMNVMERERERCPTHYITHVVICFNFDLADRPR